MFKCLLWAGHHARQALGRRQGVLEIGPAVIKLMCYGARRMTNKINTHKGIYYKENKQGREISLLEKTTLLKVVREACLRKWHRVRLKYWACAGCQSSKGREGHSREQQVQGPGRRKGPGVSEGRAEGQGSWSAMNEVELCLYSKHCWCRM